MQTPALYQVPGSGQPILVDFDGDGSIDMAVPIAGNSFGAGLMVMLNNGDGSFKPPIQYSTGTGLVTTSIAAGDFFHEGRNSIAAVDVGFFGCCTTLTVFRNQGNGTFTKVIQRGLAGGAVTILSADVNNDGFIDLITVNGNVGDNSNGTVSVLVNAQNGDFAPGVNYAAYSSRGVLVADLNNDGYADLFLYASGFVRLDVLLNDKTGTFSTLPYIPWHPIGGLYVAAAADFDGDGFVDVAGTVPGPVSIMPGNGNGTLGDPALLSLPINPQGEMIAADIDTNGAPDIVIADASTCCRFHVLLNQRRPSTEGLGLSIDHGGNSGSVTLSVYSKDIPSGATLKLVCAGQPEIIGATPTINCDATSLTATFALQGAKPGPCTVTLIKPDGSVATAVHKFNIEEGGAPTIWLDLLGWKSLRAGRPQTYYLLYGNRGDVDATNAVVSVSVPSLLSASTPDDQLLIGITEDKRDGRILSFAVPWVPLGSVAVIPILIKAPDDPELGHTHFKIRAQQRLLKPAASVGGTSALPVSSVATTTGSAATAQTSTSSGLFFAPDLYDGCTQPVKVPCPDCDGKWNNLQVVQGFALQQKAAYELADVNFAIGDGTRRGAFAVAIDIGEGIAASFALSAATEGFVEALAIKGVTEGAELSAAVNTFLSLIHDSLKGKYLNDPHAGEIAVSNAIVQRTQVDLIFSQVKNKIGVIKDSDLLRLANGWLDLITALQGALQTLVSDFSDLEELWNERQNALNAFVDANRLLCGAAASYLQCTMNACGTSNTIPPPSDSDDADLEGEIITSNDPNDKIGADGVGPLKYVPRDTTLDYAVFFSNKETASAPAQEVVIQDQLDSLAVDLSTLSFGPMAFGNKIVSPPPSLPEFSTTMDLRPANKLLVRITGHLDATTGLLVWRFVSLDPETGEPPADPSAGFLPPGAEGSVFFTVKAKRDDPTDTKINNGASIVFDSNPPITTKVWTNTLDATAPTSRVLPLPTIENSSTFVVKVAGTDVGSGIRDFSLYVSDNGGKFTPFQTGTTETSPTFVGKPGHIYGFYSIARDAVGNIESAKNVADATTQVAADITPPVIVPSVIGTLGANGWFVSDVTVQWNISDPESGIVLSLGCDPVTLTADSVGTTLTCKAINGVGLSTSSSVTVKIDKTAPHLSLSQNLTILWPPNGKMVSIVFSGTVTDSTSGIDATSVTFVVADEYGVVQPAGAVSASSGGSFSVAIPLEASRRGTDADGRLYNVTVSARDLAGNQVSRSAAVVVPHDQRR